MYPWWKRAFRGAHNLARRLIGKRPAVTERLIAATRQTFLQLKRDHPSERIYAFTLGSSFELWSMTATAYTEEGLDRKDLRAVAWSPDGTRIAVDWASERGIAIVSWPGLHQIESWRAVERCDDRPDLSEDDWTLDAVAWSPSGNRLAVCAGEDLIVFDAIGGELSRANGAQEQLIACAFETDDIVHAVGRDVDGGPAVLTLNV